MSEEQQRILVESIDRTLGDGDYRGLHIGWFGAEALLALPILRKLSVQFRNLAKTHGCTYRAKIITNGYALTPIITRDLLMEMGVTTAVITLDGTADSHDSRRPLKGGRGSFDKIFENIMAIASDRELDGFALLIRCNVDRSNVGSVSDLIRLLADYGLSKRVRFYTAPIHPWGNDLSERILPMEEYAAREVEWLLELDDLGFDVGFLPNRKKINCLTFLKDSVVVGSGGDLYNCTEVSLVPTGLSSGQAPGWIGTLAEGETQSLRSKFGDFYDQVARGEYPCGRCELLPVCGGACPKQWKEGNRPCPSMKFNIRERLLMSFARLRLRGDVPANSQFSCP